MTGIDSLLYGTTVYLIFFGTFLYAIAFMCTPPVSRRDWSGSFDDRFGRHRQRLPMLFPWPGTLVADDPARLMQPRQR